MGRSPRCMDNSMVIINFFNDGFPNQKLKSDILMLRDEKDDKYDI